MNIRPPKLPYMRRQVRRKRWTYEWNVPGCLRAKWYFADILGLSQGASFVKVAEAVVKTYPRLQYDGKGHPTETLEAKEFLAYCFLRVAPVPTAADFLYGPIRPHHRFLTPLP